jgi:hypothetical protein
MRWSCGGKSRDRETHHEELRRNDGHSNPVHYSHLRPITRILLGWWHQIFSATSADFQRTLRQRFDAEIAKKCCRDRRGVSLFQPY